MSATKAGCLPAVAKSVLDDWLEIHHQNPYPSEGEKNALIAQTGLRKKQIESWLEKARRKKGLSVSKRLPDDTKHLLDDWLNAHTDNPYPTDEEKATLIQQTGLEKKQIENWFDKSRAKRGMNRKRSSIGPSDEAKGELEAWLGAHMHNPYPTDAEKVALAERTGLRKKQVESWFEKTRTKRGLARKRASPGARAGASAAAGAKKARTAAALDAAVVAAYASPPVNYAAPPLLPPPPPELEALQAPPDEAESQQIEFV